MKKKLVAAAMMSALSMTILAGCSSSAEEVSTPSDNNTATEAAPEVEEDEVVSIAPELTEPVKIELWHYMTGNQEEILNEIIDEFNELNPMMEVEALNQGRITEINQKVIAASQSNTLPALINVYPDTVTQMVQNGQIYDMMPLVMDPEVGMIEDLENDFNEAFIAEVAQWEEGALYGFPMTKSTEVVYVNKTLLEELGYTIEEIQEDMTFEKLVEISEASQRELGIPGFGFDAGANAYITMSKMEGIDYVELDGTLNIDNDWVREYMTFFAENTQNGNFRVPGEDMYLSGPFSNQQVLMYQGSSAGYAHIETNDAFELAVIEVPHFEGKEKSVIQQGGSIFITNDVSFEEQYVAYEFLKFATNAENTAYFAASTGYLPVRKSAVETDFLQEILADEDNDYTKVYNIASKQLEYAYFTAAIDSANSARNTVGEKYEALVTGNIADVEVFIEQTVAELETAIGRQ